MKKKMGKAAKERVAIARDVVKQLAARTLRAKAGIYCRLVEEVLYDPDKELRTAVKSARCNVCAKGAFFIARIRRKNKFKMRILDGNAFKPAPLYAGSRGPKPSLQMLWSSESAEYAMKDFPYEMFDAMERCFEVAWIEIYPSPTRRLRAIAENIIRNRGKFVANDPADYGRYVKRYPDMTIDVLGVYDGSRELKPIEDDEGTP